MGELINDGIQEYCKTHNLQARVDLDGKLYINDTLDHWIIVTENNRIIVYHKNKYSTKKYRQRAKYEAIPHYHLQRWKCDTVFKALRNICSHRKIALNRSITQCNQRINHYETKMKIKGVGKKEIRNCQKKIKKMKIKKVLDLIDYTAKENK